MEELSVIFRLGDDSDPANILMVAEQVDLETHIDYLHHAHDHEQRDYSEEEILRLGATLDDPATDDVRKKQIMGIMAHEGSPTAYRILDRCYTLAEGEWKQWISLALMECRMFLESDIIAGDNPMKH
jgi:hypothetical protein